MKQASLDPTCLTGAGHSVMCMLVWNTVLLENE